MLTAISRETSSTIRVSRNGTHIGDYGTFNRGHSEKACEVLRDNGWEVDPVDSSVWYLKGDGVCIAKIVPVYVRYSISQLPRSRFR
jgi:hypothetical protein